MFKTGSQIRIMNLICLYLKAGTGNDCAGQKRVMIDPASMYTTLNFSRTVILGATLPTGSVRYR